MNQQHGLIYLSAGLNELKDTLLNNSASINPSLTWEDNGWGLDFNKLLSSTTYSLNDLEQYTAQLNGLTNLINFSPVINTCLISPLRIIFNFGKTNFNVNLDEELFDLDCKVYIDDFSEKDKPVGWKCGYTETDYLNWITSDNIHGRT